VREGLGLGISKNAQSQPVWREKGRKQAKRIKYEENKLCSSMSTIDWDLFLGPLEWARAETGGAGRWV